MYLTAHPETKRITITFDRNEADAFSVKTVNESSQHHELEFSLTSSLTKCKERRRRKMSIQSVGPASPLEESPKHLHSTTEAAGSDKENQPVSDGILPLDYILETVVNPLTGNGSKAPQLRLNADYRHTRLLLKKRSDHRISCDTKEWIKGREAYYIQCLHPIRSGFLCIKERKSYHRKQMEAQRNIANSMADTSSEGTQGRLQLRLARRGPREGEDETDARDGVQIQEEGRIEHDGGNDEADGGIADGANYQQDDEIEHENGANDQENGEIELTGRNSQDTEDVTKSSTKRQNSVTVDTLPNAGNVEEKYKVCVKRSINSHDDCQVFMLFRLQPARYNTNRK